MPNSGRVYSQIDPSIHLTVRQVVILGRLDAGLSPKEIAVELELSRYTVFEHLYRASANLNAHGQVRLLNAAREHGFIRLPPAYTGPS